MIGLAHWIFYRDIQWHRRKIELGSQIETVKTVMWKKWGETKTNAF